MRRYLVAFKLNSRSAAKGQREQVKTFDETHFDETLSFVAGVMSSTTRDLVSVALHDFTKHETVPYEPVIQNGNLVLSQITTVGGGLSGP